MLQDPQLLKKELKFMSSSEYYRRKQKGSGSGGGALGRADGKSNFVSIVRRARLQTDEKNNRYTQYEIASQLRVPGVRLANEKVYKWSIWKRFNDFQKLHEEMLKSYGYQVESISFPPSHSFVFDKFSDDFINHRKGELATYWQSIVSIPQVTDFTKHHGSSELSEFLEVEATLASGASETINTGGLQSTGGEQEPSKSRRNSTSRPQSTRSGASRRKSTRYSFMWNQPSIFVFLNIFNRLLKLIFLLIFWLDDRMSVTSVSNLDDGVNAMSVTAAPNKSSASSSSSAGTPAPPAAAPTTTPAAPPPKPAAPAVDPKFAPYAMMRKLLPEPALRHKMTADGFTDAEIDGYFAATADMDGGGSGGASLAAAPPSATSAKSAAPVASKADAPPPAPSKLPPKATGGRANLLADIAKRRIE